MADLQILLTGIAFGEQPRWHDGRLWFSDWGPGEVIAADLDGNSEVVLRVGSFPCCADWLPDGRLLVVASRDGLLLRREPDGSLVTHADLGGVSTPAAGNELVVEGRGNAYVNGGGFNLMAGEPFAPGIIALAQPDGSARQVADDLAFPNGMLVTPDNETLIVAESYARRLTAFDIDADGGLSNRRVWADLGDGVPDGICLDAEGTVWCGDVPNKHCVRVREARCCRRSSSTGAASPARSEARTGERSSSWRPSGTAPRTCSPSRAQARSSRPTHPHRASAGPSREVPTSDSSQTGV